MEALTISACILSLDRDFSDYAARRLQELGLNFGQIYFIIYVGKHPDCSPAALTGDLHLDWGHSHRSLSKLAEDGFLTREKQGRSYHLHLTEKGNAAFTVCHQVLFDWDAQHLQELNAEEKMQLLNLLRKAAAIERV